MKLSSLQKHEYVNVLKYGFVMRLFPNTYTFEIVIQCLIKYLRDQYNITFYKCNAHFSIVTLCICPLPAKSNISKQECGDYQNKLNS